MNNSRSGNKPRFINRRTGRPPGRDIVRGGLHSIPHGSQGGWRVPAGGSRMVSENLGFSPNNARAVEPVEVTPTSMSQTSLSFSDLCRMADPTTEPSDIVHSLKSGLDGLLVEHAVSTEIQELVFIVVGSFCEKGGSNEFYCSFLGIIKILNEKQMFRQLKNIILQLLNTRSISLPAKSERLRKFIKGIYHLTHNILVLMPQFACNFFGEHFFWDLIALKNLPSVQELSLNEPVFEILEQAVPVFKTVLEQHAEALCKEKGGFQKIELRARSELAARQKPPDDFRQLSVVPCTEDICVDYEPFLRPNIVEGTYPDANTYLDIQFRLLREDFFYPLRVGIKSYKEQIDKKYRNIRVDSIRLYYDVEITTDESQANQLANTNGYILKFSNQGLKGVNWEASKRLMNGSLLCLSSDNFTTILLFTVHARNPLQLAQGKLQANYQGGILAKSKMKATYVMAESSSFFEAFRGVLICLQRIHSDNFPLPEYLLKLKTDPEQPGYLTHVEYPTYDLTTVPVNKIRRQPEEHDGNLVSDSKDEAPISSVPLPLMRMLKKVWILDCYSRPSYDDLGLDPSQSEALFAALTKKVAVIQGPPGTGKTFLGLKVVQVLLNNPQYWSNVAPTATSGVPTTRPLLGKLKPTPILVMCYTNHALDQFLEGIIEFTQSIVRIGGMSKNAALDQFTLREWKNRSKHLKNRPPEIGRWLFDVRSRIDNKTRQLKEHRQVMTDVVTKGTVHEKTLKNMKIMSPLVSAKLTGWRADWNRRNPAYKIPSDGASSIIPYWLGVRDPVHVARLVVQFTEEERRQRQELSAASSIALENSDFIEEDQLDKVDLDELMADRIVDDVGTVPLDYVSVGTDVRRPKIDIAIDFGFHTRDLTEEIDLIDGEIEKELEKSSDGNPRIVELRDEQHEMQNQISNISKLLYLAPSLNTDEVDMLCAQDFDDLLYADRWRIYGSWKKQVLDLIGQKEAELEMEYRRLIQEQNEVVALDNSEICRGAKILGLTTTGAAKNRALLELLKPKIVIVEEAAEVLEAHIVTALTSSCQHLILIGDHQQLRPATTVHHLARQYHLDVSLFERLIRNGVQPSVLNVQHRMRPEIARLIVPSIYKDLKNHDSVLKYLPVRGMKHSVFFLSHTHRERGEQEGRSHANPYEVDLALALARHLLMNDYSACQITILTTYTGQQQLFRSARQNHSTLKSIRITTVDNYQGEENDIVILSLVRSNEAQNIGFLKTENRICVALSRAKQGFYLLGNMDALQGKSRLWNQIAEVLQENDGLGPAFPLQCEIHGTVSYAKKPSDFPPEGGCQEKCLTPMPCGHICPRMCHVKDLEHLEGKCNAPCQRLCDSGHLCTKTCWKECRPCTTQVAKSLPCGHSQGMNCGNDPKDEYCRTQVIKKLTFCQHEQWMDCGMSPELVKCLEKCGMLLDCGHHCDLRCHQQSSHANIPCQQPCNRTPCQDKHTCPKKCHEPCGNCLEEVVKSLPCGHQARAKCFILPKDVYCEVRVEKLLDNCQHRAWFECGQTVTGFECPKPCLKILCDNEEHTCKKRCFDKCGPCTIYVKRILSCGHMAEMKCLKDPATYKCLFPKQCVLPGCGHEVTVACGQDVDKARCPLPCDIRLECGHSCVEKCHARSDPNHERYVCKKTCEKKNLDCKKDHRCYKKCSEDCQPCKVKWKRTLPCGHQTAVVCHLKDGDIICRERVTKKIQDCGHLVEVDCQKIPTRSDCDGDCESMLKCGHKCTLPCDADCQTAVCDVLIDTNITFCGHKLTMKCNQSKVVAELAGKEWKAASLMLNCERTCGSVLSCEHTCKGNCGRCFNGRVHESCKFPCGRTLVCGHSCDVNCASICPPCKKPCEYRCQHSRCPKTCSDPCSPCQEPCGWSCEHFRCTRKCWMPCNRPPCDKPCNLKLRCGHPCIGLCGEPCPPLCRICHNEQLKEFILLGNEEDEDARFVFLPDCGHTIEVEGLDYWMRMNDQSEIQMKCCPRCKTIIRKCLRYGDILKKNYKDIADVKKKLISFTESPQNFAEKMLSNLVEVERASKECSSILGLNCDGYIQAFNVSCEADLGSVRKQIVSRQVKSSTAPIYPRLNADERHLVEVRIDLLGRIIALVMRAIKAVDSNSSSRPTKMKLDLSQDFITKIETVMSSLRDRKRMTDADYENFVTEIDRLEFIRAYYRLRSAPNFSDHTLIPQIAEGIQTLLIENPKKLTIADKTRIKELLQAMADKLKTGLGISEDERQQIVKAMGLGQGHWFKCPNGHIYVIGDCGGAMSESRCNECGARIGGGNHRLRPDNQHAGEMDGSRFAAWSEEANNMGNYRF